MADPVRLKEGDGAIGRALEVAARRPFELPPQKRAQVYWTLQRKALPAAAERAPLRRWRVAAASLSAAAAVALAALAWNDRAPATAAASAEPATTAAQAPAGALATASASNLWKRLDLPGVGTLEFSPDAKFALEGADPGRTVALERGLLRAQFAHQSPFDPVAIVTAFLRVVVVGTRVDVRAEPRRTVVELIEGRVRVEGIRGGVVELRAGESIDSDDPRFAPPPVPMRAAPAVAPTSATSRRHSIPRPSLRLAPNTASVPAQMFVDDCDQQDVASRARCLRSLARGDGLVGQDALLGLAMLAADAGDAAAALPFLDEYEARFPSGVLAAEVALKRVELLLRLDARSRAAEAAASFVQRFASHPRAGRIELLRAQLLCDEPRGHALGMELLDRLATTSADPALRADAARLHARCSSMTPGKFSPGAQTEPGGERGPGD